MSDSSSKGISSQKAGVGGALGGVVGIKVGEVGEGAVKSAGDALPGSVRSMLCSAAGGAGSSTNSKLGV